MALMLPLATMLLLVSPHPDAGDQEQAEQDALVHPVPITEADIDYPEGAPSIAGTLRVVVSILVDAQGEVAEVRLVRGVEGPFNEAVLVGATRFKFQPATFKGKPVAVMIQYTKEFVAEVDPEETPAAEAKEVKPKATVSGIAMTRGTSDPLEGADIRLVFDGGATYETTSSVAGEFSFAVEPGEFELQIGASGYKKFVLKEKIADGEHLKIRCLVEKLSYDPYETVVIGKRQRVSISRTTLKDRELKRIPGTFGDPYKVIATLPGVSQAMGLMPITVIRGSSPGTSGYLFDRVRLPLLFHLLYGPSVLHPEFIDHIDFHPGGAPLSYGGYTGGIVAGYSAKPFRDRTSRFELDTSSGQVGTFFRKEVIEGFAMVTGAARYGFPGLFLKAVNAGVSLDYWDYQLNVDLGSPRSVWTLSLFGARDDLREYNRDEVFIEDGVSTEPEERQTFLATFHRGALRYRHRAGSVRGDYRLIFGADETMLAEGEQTNSTLSLGSRADVSWKLGDWVTVLSGAEAGRKDVEITYSQFQSQNDDDLGNTLGLQQPGVSDRAGGYLSLNIGQGDSWLVAPGVRVDGFEQGSEWVHGVDPRIQGRMRVYQREDSVVSLKAGLGQYHQPPRPFLALPGMDISALNLGLLQSRQTMVGVEYSFGGSWELDVQGYYNQLDPIYFELTTNECGQDDSYAEPEADPWSGGKDEFDYEDQPDPIAERLTERREGRNYGVELLLRKLDNSNWFGWVSYTLSRSERKFDDSYVRYDFDRTHMLNVVAGLRLPRNWELGLRGMFQTGTPLNILDDCNVGRTESQIRVDVRIDKRVVYDEWLFDFYVDIINVSVNRDSGGVMADNGFRFVLPTVGLRSVF